MSDADPRRRIPRIDDVLALPELRDAIQLHGVRPVRAAVRAAADLARTGQVAPDQVPASALQWLARPAGGTPVLNATGIVVHTNLGRAPLSGYAVESLVAAASYVDVELDLTSGRRAPRGQSTREALTEAVPSAADALVLNNGAAALVLATTALAAGREVVVSRGEMVEIGDGFRLHELIASTGARLREVGTTNRTHLRDYAQAIGSDTGCILKVHPSNFAQQGFVSSVSVAELNGLGVPVIADIGSGLLGGDPLLPDEPDVESTLRAGATVVTCSGDKLLGGPQAGIVFGRAGEVQQMRRHPLARALRVDKLTLAALEASVRGPVTPVYDYLHADVEQLKGRTDRLAERLGCPVVETTGHVGGGGAPGVPLPGWALALPEECADTLRLGSPAVLARTHDGQCLVDLRCVPPDREGDLERVVARALAGPRNAQAGP